MGRVRLISLGATMFQRYSDQSGKMEIVETPESLLRSVELPHDIDVDIAQLPYRSGAELSLYVIALVRDHILGGLGQYDGFVVAIGTDTMEEVRSVPPPRAALASSPARPRLHPVGCCPDCRRFTGCVCAGAHAGAASGPPQGLRGHHRRDETVRPAGR